MSFHAQFREVNCAFADMLKEEEKCQIEKECSAALSALIGRVVDKEDTDLIRRCLSGERQLHTVLEVTSVCPLKFKRTDMLYSVSEKEQGFYKKLVDKNFEEIIEIALLTRGQAAQTRFVSFLLIFNSLLHFCDSTWFITGGTRKGASESPAQRLTG